MNRNDAFFEVSGIVTAADFAEDWHGELWRLMHDQIVAGRDARASSLLHDQEQDADIGGVRASVYLADLERQAPPSSLAQDLAKTIRDLALRRRLISAGEQLVAECFDAPASTRGEELRAKYDAAFAALFSTVADVGVRHIGDVSEMVLKRVARAIGGVVEGGGIELPLAAAQALVGSLMPGRLYVLAGAPGSGKSLLAQKIAKHASRPGAGVALFRSIEMEDEEVVERDLATLTGISAESIERGNVPPGDYETLVDAAALTNKHRLYIDSSSAPTAALIRAQAMRMKRLVGLDLLVVDHLLYIEKPDPRMPEFEAIRGNIKAMKRIAKDLGIPVLLLTQFNREFNAGPVRRPTVSDLYNSSAIEQEADVILFVHREGYMLKRKEPPKGVTEKEKKEHSDWEARVMEAGDKAELILGKRRGGKGFGVRTVYFDEKAVDFVDNYTRGTESLHQGEPEYLPL